MHLQRNLLALAAAMLLATHMNIVAGEGLPVQYGLLGLGDLTTSDQAGPYSVPAVQAFEVEAALAAKTGAPGAPFTDRDVLNFLANTECLEATFNTYAAFGEGMPASLKPGEVIGGKRASLSEEVQAWAEEVALDEQGHVRMVREVLGADDSVPCPTLNLTGGFRAYFDNALNKTSDPAFDPYANDVNFLLATWSLEEIGATGDKGCILLATNPGVANAISGLATSASYQSGVDRHFLWQRRNETVPEYNMTVQEIVLAVSNYRDELDGAPETDQGLLNGNLNFIAVPTLNINLVPTDIRGLTFSRTPQQVLRIVTLAGADDKGGFFPNGVNGKINTTAGYTDAANGFGGYPGNQVTVRSLAEAGKTGLLNNNITEVAPAPPAVQAEASGQQYSQGGSPAPSSPAAAATTDSSPTPSDASNTIIVADTTSASPSPAGDMSGDSMAAVSSPSPSPADDATDDDTTTSVSPSPAGDMSGDSMAAVSSPSPSSADDANGDDTTTSASPSPAGDMSSDSIAAVSTPSPSPAGNATGDNTMDMSSPSPAGDVSGDNMTSSPSPSPAGINTIIVLDNTTSAAPSPAGNTIATETSSSPSPADNASVGNSSTSSSPALSDSSNGNATNVVIGNGAVMTEEVAGGSAGDGTDGGTADAGASSPAP